MSGNVGLQCFFHDDVEEVVDAVDNCLGVADEAGSHHAVVDDLLRDDRGDLCVLVSEFVEVDDGLVVGVDFEGEILGVLLDLALVEHAHHLSHAGGERGDDDGGGVLEPLGDGDLADDGLELVLEPHAEGREFLVAEALGDVVLDGLEVLLEIFLVALDVEELEVLELLHALEDHLVDVHVDEDDGDLGVLEGLHVGGGQRVVSGGGEQEVDGISVFGEHFDVLVEGDVVAGLVGLEAEELEDLFLVVVVGGDSFLEEVLELVVPGHVGVLVAVGLVVELAEDAPGEDLLELEDEVAVLVVLARDVEGEVLAVDHALDEAQVVGEDLPALALDEDLLAVEVQLELLELHAEPRMGGTRAYFSMWLLGMQRSALMARGASVAQWMRYLYASLDLLMYSKNLLYSSGFTSALLRVQMACTRFCFSSLIEIGKLMKLEYLSMVLSSVALRANSACSGLRWIVMRVPRYSIELSVHSDTSNSPVPSDTHTCVFPARALLLFTSTVSPTMNAEQNPTPNCPISLSFSASPFSWLTRNCFDPECAIVPRFSIISSFVIPTPVSSITSVRFFSSSSIRISSCSPTSSPLSVCAMNRCFSSASDAFESSSLTNTSLSVYSDFATMSSSFFVSALNSCRSLANPQTGLQCTVFVLNFSAIRERRTRLRQLCIIKNQFVTINPLKSSINRHHTSHIINTPMINHILKSSFSTLPQPFVSPRFLYQNLQSLKVLDCSWYLPNLNRNADQEYLKERIPGAIRFDIDTVCRKDTDLPHMIPSVSQFEQQVSQLGLSNTDRIVVYDGLHLFSARVYWTLKYFGHSEVSILNGGFPAWKRENYPIETGPHQTYPPSNYKANVNNDLIRNLQQMRDNIQVWKDGSKGEVVLDARPTPRFTGEAPELRPIPSGHMPFSKNLSFLDVINPQTGKLINVLQIPFPSLKENPIGRTCQEARNRSGE